MSGPVESGLTLADLDRFPEDDGYTREIIDGELYVRGSVVLRHQRVVLRTGSEFLAYADATGGEAYVNPGNVYSERDGVIPDVAYLSAERLLGMSPEHIEGPPDLVVEVSSPGTRGVDLVVKRALYEREGVREYWFVDLDADEVLVFRLTAEGAYGEPLRHGMGAVIEPPHLPGLAMDVTYVLR